MTKFDHQEVNEQIKRERKFVMSDSQKHFLLLSVETLQNNNN